MCRRFRHIWKTIRKTAVRGSVWGVACMWLACATANGRAAPGAGESQKQKADPNVVTAVVGADPSLALYTPGHWWPVFVTIKNASGKFDGKVVLSPDPAKLKRGQRLRHATIYERKLTLTRGATKRLMVPVRFDRHIPGWQVDIVSNSGKRLLPVRLPLLGVRLDRAALVLGISESTGLDTFFKQRERLWPTSQYREPRYVVYGKPSRLPNTPLLLAGYDCIVVDNIPAGDINSAVQSALVEYCLAGGTLVVCGGSNAAWLNASPFARVLPVRVRGLRTLHVTPRNVAGLGMRSPGPQSITLSHVEVTEEAESHAWSGNPVMVRKRVGRGEIVFLAFSLSHPEVLRWEGRAALGNRICRRQHRPSILSPKLSKAQSNTWCGTQPAAAGPYGSLLAALEQSPLIVTVPRRDVGGFLLIYLLVVSPAAYFLFKKLDRVELAWAACPLIAIAFSLLPLSGQLANRPAEASVTEVRVIEAAANARTGLATSLVTIYSEYGLNSDVRFTGQRLLACDPHAERADMPRLETLSINVAYGTETQIKDLRVLRGSIRTFGTFDRVSMGNGVEVQADDRQVRVRNRSGIDLEDAYWVTPRGASLVGFVGNGRERVVRRRSWTHDDFAKEFAAGASSPKLAAHLAKIICQACAIDGTDYLVAKCDAHSDLAIADATADVHGIAVIVIAPHDHGTQPELRP